MAIVASNTGGSDFAPCPAGTHIARCCWIIDLGTQPGSERFPKERHQVLLGWEFPNLPIPEGDREGEPYFLTRFYTLALSPKANLLRDLQAWRGKAFTDAELEGFDITVLAGKPCMVTVIHKAADNKTRALVESVTALPHGMTADEVEPQINPTRIFELGTSESAAVFAELPEWVQNIIGRCKERQDGYDGDVGEFGDPGDSDFGSIPF